MEHASSSGSGTGSGASFGGLGLGMGDVGTGAGRRPIIVGRGLDGGDGEDGEGRDPMEDELLAGLEQLAQKTDVITRWADEMYEFVKAVPQSACFLLLALVCARARGAEPS